MGESKPEEKAGAAEEEEDRLVEEISFSSSSLPVLSFFFSSSVSFLLPSFLLNEDGEAFLLRVLLLFLLLAPPQLLLVLLWDVFKFCAKKVLSLRPFFFSFFLRSSTLFVFSAPVFLRSSSPWASLFLRVRIVVSKRDEDSSSFRTLSSLFSLLPPSSS